MELPKPQCDARGAAAAADLEHRLRQLHRPPRHRPHQARAPQEDARRSASLGGPARRRQAGEGLRALRLRRARARVDRRGERRRDRRLRGRSTSDFNMAGDTLVDSPTAIRPQASRSSRSRSRSRRCRSRWASTSRRSPARAGEAADVAPDPRPPGQGARDQRRAAGEGHGRTPTPSRSRPRPAPPDRADGDDAPRGLRADGRLPPGHRAGRRRPEDGAVRVRRRRAARGSVSGSGDRHAQPAEGQHARHGLADDEGLVTIQYEVPTRGMVGVKSRLLSATRGLAVMTTTFAGYRPHVGEFGGRDRGNLLCHEQGEATVALKAQDEASSRYRPQRPGVHRPDHRDPRAPRRPEGEHLQDEAADEHARGGEGRQHQPRSRRRR